MTRNRNAILFHAAANIINAYIQGLLVNPALSIALGFMLRDIAILRVRMCGKETLTGKKS
ncbi:MAG: hypothetical protein ACFFEF_18350 [Candidatus Thorarchaeota archaeon]